MLKVDESVRVENIGEKQNSFLNWLQDKLEDEEKNQVEEALKGLEEAISSEDIEAIESATKNLNDVLTPLTQKLYKQESAEGQSDTNTDEDDSSENTVDAEFEEVKEEEK